MFRNRCLYHATPRQGSCTIAELEKGNWSKAMHIEDAEMTIGEDFDRIRAEVLTD